MPTALNATPFIIFYVADVARAAAFHEKALAAPPLEISPGFAMFALPGGARLGLWKRAGVAPAAPEGLFGGELALAVARPEVDRLHRDWSAAGAPIALAPTQLDFGFGFVALDPDGNRVRVFAPGD